jgi:hypothetical protein
MPVPADFLWATSLEHSEMGCATDGIHENSTNTTKKTSSGTSGTLVFIYFTQRMFSFWHAWNRVRMLVEWFCYSLLVKLSQ